MFTPVGRTRIAIPHALRPLLIFAGAAALSSGCSSIKTVLDPLNVVGQRPLRIGVTNLDLAPPLMLPKRTLFQENLSFYLNQPVVLDHMTPRQIRVHLGTGRLKLAMLSAADYCEVAEGDTSRILAVPINESGETTRRGLIIVSPKSPIHSVSELKNQRFHFMTHGDVLNEAALGALSEAGVAVGEVDKGILGLGLDTYHISSLEVAKSVVLEERSGGVIDEADYKKWKATGGSLILLSPSQDQVRVIGETVNIPEGPVVVAKDADPALVEKISEYFFNVLPKRKLVMAPMGCKGFAKPIEVKEYEAYFDMHRKLSSVDSTHEFPAAEQPPSSALP